MGDTFKSNSDTVKSKMINHMWIIMQLLAMNLEIHVMFVFQNLSDLFSAS